MACKKEEGLAEDVLDIWSGRRCLGTPDLRGIRRFITHFSLRSA